MPNLVIKWTPRFEQNLKRYNGIQRSIVLRTTEIIKKFESDPTTWRLAFKKLVDDSFGSLQVYRVRLIGGDRMLFVISGKELILTDLGDHDVMDAYAKMNRVARDADLKMARLVPDHFKVQVNYELKKNLQIQVSPKFDFSEILETNAPTDELRWLYDAELDSTWVQYLDNGQNRTAEEITERCVGQSEELIIHFLYGGPGTGKTVVLLNIAQRLEALGHNFSFQISDQVGKYLKSGLGRVPGMNIGFSQGAVILMDDPLSIEAIKNAIKDARREKCKAIVFGFDPLQWHEPKMSEKFLKICENAKFDFSCLWVCYRQSAGIAGKTIALVETIFNQSSVNLDSKKFKDEKQDLSGYVDMTVGMEFVDSAGRYVVYKENILDSVTLELLRYKKRIDHWTHSESICLVYEDGIAKKYRDLVKSKLQGVKRMDLKLSKLANIRGLEFQELFFFVQREFWEKVITPTRGLSQEEWLKIGKMHTLLSRAKDSLIIFVVEDESV